MKNYKKFNPETDEPGEQVWCLGMNGVRATKDYALRGTIILKGREYNVWVYRRRMLGADLTAEETKAKFEAEIESENDKEAWETIEEFPVEKLNEVFKLNARSWWDIQDEEGDFYDSRDFHAS